MDIGYRLKAVRKNADLSQRELAKRSGVTNGFISQVEKNQVSPSIGSLKKLLDGIPMSLADFFADPEEDTPQIVYRADEQPEIGSANVNYRLIGHSFPGRTIGMMRETMAPGADTGPEPISHAGQECGIVLQGRLQLTVGEQVFELEKGDGYYFDSQKPHRFVSMGAEELVIISANSPPTF